MGKFIYTQEMINWIVEHNLDYGTTSELVIGFNKHFKANTSLDSMYKKIQKYCPHSRDTTFKKGGTSPKKLPIGSEVISQRSVYIKVADKREDAQIGLRQSVNWKRKDCLALDIKDLGYRVIVHLDNDPWNCDINNLYVLSMSDFQKANRKGWLRSGIPDLTKVEIRLIELQNKLKEVEFSPEYVRACRVYSEFVERNKLIKRIR